MSKILGYRVQWFMYGTELLYKVNYRTLDLEHIDSPNKETMERYLPRYKVRNNVGYSRES